MLHKLGPIVSVKFIGIHTFFYWNFHSFNVIVLGELVQQNLKQQSKAIALDLITRRFTAS